MKNILLGLTGSVASILYEKLHTKLSEFGKVQTIFTNKSLHFVGSLSLKNQTFFVDENEWVWEEKGDKILHIELRKWADLFVIAPLSANTLAKISNGLCDNLLTSVARAWDWNKPMILAPSMNTQMWSSPITEKQLAIMSGLGARVVQPTAKVLACGDEGVGAMANIDDIIAPIKWSLR